MIVADKIAASLAEHGITHAFGIIGAGNVALFDAIRLLDKTALVCCHHEQAAVMAATYYYRTCGQISVALVTTGAGSTNAITGVAAAFMDSIPVLIISGNEPTKYFAQPHPRVIGVQGYESHRLVKGITKAAWRYGTSTDLDDAVNIALHPRMGPVWLDISRDVQTTHV